jgi:hypothetical protein
MTEQNNESPSKQKKRLILGDKLKISQSRIKNMKKMNAGKGP